MRNACLVRTLRMIEALRVRRLTLEQLASEHGVTTRTVRRDLEAISAAGLPLRKHENAVLIGGAAHYDIAT